MTVPGGSRWEQQPETHPPRITLDRVGWITWRYEVEMYEACWCHYMPMGSGDRWGRAWAEAAARRRMARIARADAWKAQKATLLVEDDLR